MTLFEIAVQYHVRCEMFDRSVCRGRSEHGAAMPVDGWERTQITKNASREMYMAYMFARAVLSAPSDEVRKAIQSEPVHREAERILRQLPDTEHIDGKYKRI